MSGKLHLIFMKTELSMLDLNLSCTKDFRNHSSMVTKCPHEYEPKFIEK